MKKSTVFLRKLMFFLTALLIVGSFSKANAQCPTFLNHLGVSSSNPTWVNCMSGPVPANVTLSFQSSSAVVGPFSINWGDGSAAENFPATVPSGTTFTHNYPSAIDTYLVIITTPGCVMQGHFVNERSVIAQIAPLVGSVTRVCAPDVIQFVNNSTNASPTTVFEIDFGDNSPPQILPWTSVGQTISHTYQRNTVNCNTVVTLTARNSCTGSVLSTNVYGPISIYDLDSAIIGLNREVFCYPDTTVIATNNTVRNCVNDGNTQQRYERWIVQDQFGVVVESTAWLPWPPSNPRSFHLPGNLRGNICITLLDSSFCGIDSATRCITLIDPPIAAFSAPDTVCGGEQVDFTNNTPSAVLYAHEWSFPNGTPNSSTTISPQNVIFANTTANNITVNVRLIVSNSTGGNGCRDTVYKEIVVRPQPTANFSLNGVSGNVSSCDSLEVIFLDNSSANSNQWEWDLDGDNVYEFIGQNPLPRKYYTTTTIRLRVNSASGCEHIRTRTINIFRTPVADFSTASVCVNQVATFTNTSTVSPGAGNNITSRAWDFDDPGSGASNTSTANNPTHTFTTPGTYNVRLIVNTANCSDTITQAIDVEYPPNAVFTPSRLTGCSPLTVDFTNGSTNADPARYVWKRGNTVFSNVESPQVTYTNNGTSNDTIRIRLIAQTTFGCQDSVERVVVVYPNPRASFTANTFPSCNPLPINFLNTSNGAVGYEWNFDDGSTSTLPNPTHAFVNTGDMIRTYRVRLVAFSVNSCTDTFTMPVLAYPQQIFSPTTNVDSGCSPLSVRFQSFSGVINYQWNFGDSNSSTEPSPTHTYVNNTSAPIDYLAEVILMNAFGCLDTVYKTTRVFPTPTAMFTVSSPAGCEPFDVTIINQSTPGISYSWDYGDGVSDNNAAINFRKIYTNNTTVPVQRTIRLAVINAVGCTDTFERTITVFPYVTAAFNVSEDTSCSPLIIQTSNQSVNAGSYEWYIDNVPTDVTATPIFNLSNAANIDRVVNIRMIAISPFGCRDTTERNVVVKPVPISLFSMNNNAGCEPLQISFNNLSTDAVSFEWDFGDGRIISHTGAVATVNHSYVNNTSVPIDRQVRLTVKNADSCAHVSTQTVTVYPRIAAGFDILRSSCSPFIARADNRSANASDFNWYVNGAPVGTEQNREFILENNGTTPLDFDIRLEAISSFGCMDDSTIRVTVLPTPRAVFNTNVNSGCQPFTVSIINASTPGVSYSWDYGDGTNDNNPAIPFDKIYVNNTNLPIERVITLAVQNLSGCVDTFRRTVTVFPFLAADFQLSVDTACSPLITRATNLSTNTIQYVWYVDNVITDISASPVFTLTNNSATDRYATIRLEATSAYGCTEVFSRVVKILPRPDANFFVTTPVIKSPNHSFNIINQNIQQGFTYRWDFSDGGNSNSSTPGVYTYTTPGNYRIRLIVENAVCADTMFTDVLIEPPTPIVEFTGGGQGCAPFAVSFNNQTMHATHYEWDFGDGNTSNEPNPTHTYRLGGTYSVRLIGTGPGGQDIDVHIDSVRVYDRPNAYFIAQPKVVYIPSDPLVCFNLSTNAIQFFWDFGDGFTSTEISPEHYYTKPGDYTIRLIARNENGCLDTFHVLNAVRAEGSGQVVVPNAFTPNPNGGNGGFIVPGEFNNDVFHPVVRGAQTYKLSIYNRWGELMFESNDVNIGWDGYYRGALCKQDVYVWKVNLGYSDGTKETTSGDLLLLR